MDGLFRLICFDFGPEDNQNFANRIINHNGNKLITVKNQVLSKTGINDISYDVACSSHYTDEIIKGRLVFLFSEKVELCEEIYKSFTTDDFIENKVLQYASTLSEEKINWFPESKGKIAGTICSCCNKYAYIDKPSDALRKNNVIELVANILLKLLADHHLTNGNKRTAYAFLVNALYQLGYYFKYSRSSEKFDNSPYKKIYEETLAHFVIEISHRKTTTQWEELVNLVCEWIFQNLFIAYRVVQRI